MASIRANVHAVVDGVSAGKILETFDRWYADDVVMSENGVSDTRGKAANRARQLEFVSGAEIHSARAGEILIDGDHAAIEWTLEFTPRGGARTTLTQIALQTWRNGKIAREVFYHA